MVKNDIQIVLSRYREDISWTERIGMDLLVYDKSGRPGHYSLKNVGRETHTYLHHIIDNYPLFPEYIVFLQADPFPHLSPGMTPEGLVERIIKITENNALFKGLAYYSIKCDHLGRPHSLNSISNECKWPGSKNDIPVGKLYSQLFDGPVPLKYHTRAPAGLFCVHKSRILCRPLDFYKYAMSIMLNDPDDMLNTGHAFERLWYVIFNGYEKIMKSCYEY
jgi:hypothetical protein